MTRANVGRASSRKTSRPTRQVLIDTVALMLETSNPESLKVEEVISKSGISTGSMYHHFEDFSDLIDQAIIARYADDIDVSIDALTAVVAGATDSTSLFRGLLTATERTLVPEREAQRFLRVQVMARAASSERFRAALIPHQQRLTDALADLIRELQEKGLYDRAIDPMAGSVFIQAYSMGLVVNDVVGHPVHEDALVALVMRMHDNTFFVAD